ncbi:uncharacterized protein VP01_14578g1, partial [Puccinia sorghi]
AFLHQVGLYFLTEPTQFPTDRSKIIFVLGNLTGDAAKWAYPFNHRLLNAKNPGRTALALEEFIQLAGVRIRLGQHSVDQPLPEQTEGEHLNWYSIILMHFC